MGQEPSFVRHVRLAPSLIEMVRNLVWNARLVLTVVPAAQNAQHVALVFTQLRMVLIIVQGVMQGHFQVWIDLAPAMCVQQVPTQTQTAQCAVNVL